MCSVPQTERAAQRKAVASLCYYCQLCTRFIPLVCDITKWKELHADAEATIDASNANDSTLQRQSRLKRLTCSTLPAGNLEAYAARGWCRVEVLAALCPKLTLTGKWRRGPINVRYRYHHDANDAGIGPLLRDRPLCNPMDGLFTSETDRPVVIEITKLVAQRFSAYTNSGSTAWAETCDMASLPEWLVQTGQKGVEVRILDNTALEA